MVIATGGMLLHSFTASHAILSLSPLRPAMVFTPEIDLCVALVVGTRLAVFVVMSVTSFWIIIAHFVTPCLRQKYVYNCSMCRDARSWIPNPFFPPTPRLRTAGCSSEIRIPVHCRCPSSFWKVPYPHPSALSKTDSQRTDPIWTTVMTLRWHSPLGRLGCLLRCRFLQSLRSRPRLHLLWLTCRRMRKGCPTMKKASMPALLWCPHQNRR
mmetsp:Transcript_21687/g.60364  ORF Transcript_21687/g.60364 Transcript_21687/m.60364 type:complete len:211 (-) Transcript_21687:531-1163(-)